MRSQQAGERLSLVEAIKTPLGFFSLAILVVEALLGGLALALSGSDRTFLLFSIVGILVLLVLVVATIASLRPEALRAQRDSGLDESLAVGLGQELYGVLNGYLANLEEAAREEAYEVLRAAIATTPHARTRAMRRFCDALAGSLIRQVELTGRWTRTKGVIAQ
jgi:hypothetical protein